MQLYNFTLRSTELPKQIITHMTVLSFYCVRRCVSELRQISDEF